MPRSLPPATVTQLTPDGRGAVATLLVSGLRSAELVDGFFRSAAGKSVKRLARNAISFGQWSPSNGFAEDVVVARRNGTDIEVCCHGGIAAASAIIGSLEAAGVKRTGCSDWIAGETDGQLEADAWIALGRAKTERVAGVLLDQLRGALRRALEETLDLVDSGDLPAARARLEGLVARGSIGQHLTTAWQVAISGAPNVGKSSLVNRLVGYDRSIVFNEPGTTRDVLTASTALDGWPVDLLDTAGLRTSSDGIEQEGIRRARQAAAAADLTIFVVDASLGPAQLASLPATSNPNTILVANKRDLAAGFDWPEQVACTCAIDGTGIESLMQRVSARIVPAPPAPGAAVPWTESQRTGLRLALTALDDSDPLSCQQCLQALLSAGKDARGSRA